MITADRIRSRRRQLDITQEELAEMIYSTQKQVSLYERGKAIPGGESLAALAKALQTSTDYLLGLSDVMNPQYDLDPLEVVMLSHFRQKNRTEQKKIIEITKMI